MKPFYLYQKLVCIHDDFNWHRGTDKNGSKAIGPKKGDIVTFMGHLPGNFSFIVLKEHLRNDEGQIIGWNMHKFAPLTDDQQANVSTEQLLKELSIDVKE